MAKFGSLAVRATSFLAIAAVRFGSESRKTQSTSSTSRSGYGSSPTRAGESNVCASTDTNASPNAGSEASSPQRDGLNDVTDTSADAGTNAVPDADRPNDVTDDCANTGTPAGPDAAPVREKFNLNLADCPTCDFKEYACVCEHAHEEDDHDHEEK